MTDNHRPRLRSIGAVISIPSECSAEDTAALQTASERWGREQAAEWCCTIERAITAYMEAHGEMPPKVWATDPVWQEGAGAVTWQYGYGDPPEGLACTVYLWVRG